MSEYYESRNGLHAFTHGYDRDRNDEIEAIYKYYFEDFEWDLLLNVTEEDGLFDHIEFYYDPRKHEYKDYMKDMGESRVLYVSFMYGARHILRYAPDTTGEFFYPLTNPYTRFQSMFHECTHIVRGNIVSSGDDPHSPYADIPKNVRYMITKFRINKYGYIKMIGWHVMDKYTNYNESSQYTLLKKYRSLYKLI